MTREQFVNALPLPVARALLVVVVAFKMARAATVRFLDILLGALWYFGAAVGYFGVFVATTFGSLIGCAIAAFVVAGVVGLLLIGVRALLS